MKKSKHLFVFVAIAIFGLTACKKDPVNNMIPEQKTSAAVLNTSAIATTVTKTIIDLDLTANPFPYPIIVPCANGGLGEEVVPQGNVRQLSVVTVNKNNFTIKFQYTPQGVIGIGRITGDIYQAGGVSEFTQTGSFINGKATLTSVWMFMTIGRGDAPNWKMIPTVHTTINADGTVTSSIDKIVASCE